MKNSKSPKILLFDIETSPILAYVWSLWDQNVGLEQIYKDWNVLSWSAKWLGEKDHTIMYKDLRHKKDKSDDKQLLKQIWKLLDKADVVITQNGKKFDSKKLNARFALHNLGKPSDYKHIDTLELAKKNFAFTSNKLEYMSNANPQKSYTKLKSKKFPGFLLWKECLLGNLEAWQEMQRYNERDVLALEGVYKWLIPWHNPVNFNVFYDEVRPNCGTCGSKNVIKHKWYRTKKGKFRAYICKDCGSMTKGTKNHFSKEKRKSLKDSV